MVDELWMNSWAGYAIACADLDSPTIPMHELLPMVGRTHGNRSAVTCHLKCDSACAHPAPNPSSEPTFAEIASRQLNRRSFLIGSGTLAAATALPISLTGCTPSQQKNSTNRDQSSPAPPPSGLEFEPIDPAPDGVDALFLPVDYRWTPIIR
jgi:secreted PhoX family phosphatase